jgi:superfamily II RNA helicase
MLPDNIQMIMLSATLDNANKLGDWIEEIKKRKVLITGTEKRVVPLNHYAYMCYPESIFDKMKDKSMAFSIRNLNNSLIPISMNEKDFNEENRLRLYKAIKYTQQNKFFSKKKFVLNEVSKHLVSKQLLPAIFFVFSRKGVMNAAHEIEVNLFEEGETLCSTVDKECEKILCRLPNGKEYMELNEYNEIIRLLRKGVGVHHSGILPIFREMIEQLYGKGYIKILFATETFSVGINMPTRTTVFTSLEKFDGVYQRLLKSHEYSQMAGRAGRRGMDDIGTVIHLVSMTNVITDYSQHQYKNMITGLPQKLESKFNLNFMLVLHLLHELETEKISSNEYKENVYSFMNNSMWTREVKALNLDKKERLNKYELMVKEKSDMLKYLTTSLEDLELYDNLCDQFEKSNKKQIKR